MAARRRVATARDPLSPTDCRARAVRLLMIRSRSREELRRALELRGFDGATIRGTLDDLSRDGSLNETAALEAFLLGRVGRLSRDRLRRELRQRGFPAPAIDAALAGVSDDADRELLERLLAKRSAEVASLPPEKRKRKLFDFLRRRGFGAAQIFDAMGEENGRE